MSNNFLTVHVRRKTSTDNLKKTDAAESIGDIRIRLWHHLAAKTTSGLNLQLWKSLKTRKRRAIDNFYVKETLIENRSQAINWGTTELLYDAT
jgi:hypothetical protein